MHLCAVEETLFCCHIFITNLYLKTACQSTKRLCCCSIPRKNTKSLYNKCSRPVADLENFGGGNFKHKPSKLRMSSPKLRVIFRPKSEIRTFFLPKIRWSPKKKKVFTEIESDFSAKIGNLNVFSAQNQVVSKKKKVFTEIECDFSAETVSFTLVGGMHPEMESNFSK